MWQPAEQLMLPLKSCAALLLTTGEILHKIKVSLFWLEFLIWSFKAILYSPVNKLRG